VENIAAHYLLGCLTTLFSVRKRFSLALVIIGLLLFLAVLLLWPRRAPGTVDLMLAGVRQSTNAAWLITVVLTNGTLRTFNVVDDSDGNPAFILDSGEEYGMWLTRMVNQLKVNLIPGGSLTNTVLVTNAPARFRLKVPVRDLAAERRDWVVLAAIHLLPRRWAEKFVKQREKPLPTSDWIETTTSER
jgi:hypothetical protein